MGRVSFLLDCIYVWHLIDMKPITVEINLLCVSQVSKLKDTVHFKEHPGY